VDGGGGGGRSVKQHVELTQMHAAAAML
jgi:hypothetical protein